LSGKKILDHVLKETHLSGQMLILVKVISTCSLFYDAVTTA